MQPQDKRFGFGPQITERFKPSGNGSKRVGAEVAGSLLSSQQLSASSKELIHPGDEVKEMLMRTVLTDVNEARDVALTLAKCDEFEMQDEKQLILYLLAARPSIGGKSRTEYLQAIVGILSPAMLGFKGAKVYEHNKHSNDGEVKE